MAHGIEPINRTILELKLPENPSAAEIDNSINRTILELKQDYIVNASISTPSINRTILELKPGNWWMLLYKLLLSIEPFWN